MFSTVEKEIIGLAPPTVYLDLLCYNITTEDAQQFHRGSDI